MFVFSEFDIRKRCAVEQMAALNILLSVSHRYTPTAKLVHVNVPPTVNHCTPHPLTLQTGFCCRPLKPVPQWVCSVSLLQLSKVLLWTFLKVTQTRPPCLRWLLDTLL